MRQSDLAWEVRDYLKTHPNAAVVNLGCGLDDTGRACDNGTCKIYNIDFPDVIAVRNALLPAGERETNIGCDLNDASWFSRIDASGGAVFFAAGVFYYFLTGQVKTLICALAAAFPGGRLVFDAGKPVGGEADVKTWIRQAKIQNARRVFRRYGCARRAFGVERKLKVSSRGYMLGYRKLDDPSVSRFFRFLAKVGDGMMKMQIVRLDFQK